jgi:tRNA (cytidine/uridine-2'-O-)-methyltransferase
MFEIVLYRPEIPPNAGNVIRLAANTGARLHLVEPLGFSLEDRELKRAGLDYHEMAHVQAHRDWPACRTALEGRRLFAVSTRGAVSYAAPRYAAGDAFVFGPETSGLPHGCCSRSCPSAGCDCRCARQPHLSLSNAVAVVVFEAWRQLGFSGAG